MEEDVAVSSVKKRNQPSVQKSENQQKKQTQESSSKKEKQMGNFGPPLARQRRWSWNFYCFQVVFCALLIWVVLMNIAMYFLYHARNPEEKIRKMKAEERFYDDEEEGNYPPYDFTTLEAVVERFVDLSVQFGLKNLVLIQPEIIHSLRQKKAFRWSDYALKPRKNRILTFLNLQGETLPDCKPTLYKLSQELISELKCKRDGTHVVFSTVAIVFHVVSARNLDDQYRHISSLNDSKNSDTFLWSMGLSANGSLQFWNSGALFETEIFENPRKTTLDGINLVLPADLAYFYRSHKYSEFLECDNPRADAFNRKFPEIHQLVISTAGQEFRRKARHVLSLVSASFRELRIPFWLSSGTLLGWYRQCDVIPYSGDVDIGVFISDHSAEIIGALENRGFQLRMKFGLLEDSLQYSFLYKQLKLDIYFFYENSKHFWNGATKPETGEKYKYNFSKFGLCWTKFLDIFLRVPCPVQPYIEANYGKDWFKPTKEWDWRKSPPNSQPAGNWPEHLMNETVQIFEIH